MPSSAIELDQFLEQLARGAQAGERLPTIRELMRRFEVSQTVVQRAFRLMKSRGLIDSQVGRGTFFRGEGAAAAASLRRLGDTSHAGLVPHPRSAVKSVLLLRRSVSITRGRVLLEELQRRFAADGHRVLELSYNDPDHARTVLRSLPRFDACVVQSTYKTIPIELLAALREKCDVLAVDGLALAGTDVESVGTEWGEPLAAAVASLIQRGHRRIAYATTTHPFLATQLGHRRLNYLSGTLGGTELRAIAIPHLPDDHYAAALAGAIRAGFDEAGQPPFTALAAWGIEDGAKFKDLLLEAGLTVPSALSVVLLGRTDLANEHAGFFEMQGCRVTDQAETLYMAINERWADPSTPYGVRLIPVTFRSGASVAGPSEPTLLAARTPHKRPRTRSEKAAAGT
jgi:Bacterial regulatory proteins, gntR family/Periplasmic binding protein-like domain